jgi:hypothetical protein
LTAILIDENCEWGEEEIETAQEQARAIMPFDPDGAAQLLAQAQAAQRKLNHMVTPGGKTPYDPSRLYARMCKFYGWRPKDIDAMHFVTFFAMAREMGVMNEEEQKSYDNARHGGNASTQDQQAALNVFPRAQTYEGETIAL